MTKWQKRATVFRLRKKRQSNITLKKKKKEKKDMFTFDFGYQEFGSVGFNLCIPSFFFFYPRLFFFFFANGAK